MSLKTFKSKYRPAVCTTNIFKNVVTPTEADIVLEQIRQESIELYGKDLSAECSKRKVCFGKECLGRELPVQSPTAQHYIKALSKTHTIKDGKLFITTNCQMCPISDKCANVCDQNVDYLQRDYIQSPDLQYQSNIDISPPTMIPDIKLTSNLDLANVPWDVLSSKQQQLVKSYLYQHQNFAVVARECKIKSISQCRYVFYSALNKLSETAAVRNLLESPTVSDADKEILTWLYVNNWSMQECADRLNVSKQAVSARLKRILNRHHVKWHVFVRKVRNKVVYNTPMVLK